MIVAAPAATPVTKPDALTVAAAVFEEDQTPPVVAFVNVVVEPTQTSLAPAVAATTGKAFTVTVTGADEAVQPFASVAVTV